MTSFGGGGNVGRAYVSILADTSSMDDAIARALKRLRDSSDEEGKKSAQAFADAFAADLEHNSTIDKAFSRMLKHQEEEAAKRGDAIGEEMQKHFVDKFGENIGKKMFAQLVKEAKGSQGALDRILLDAANTEIRIRRQVTEEHLKDLDDIEKANARVAAQQEQFLKANLGPKADIQGTMQAQLKELEDFNKEAARFAQERADFEAKVHRDSVNDQVAADRAFLQSQRDLTNASREHVRQLELAIRADAERARQLERTRTELDKSRITIQQVNRSLDFGRQRNPFLGLTLGLATFPFKAMAGFTTMLQGISKEITNVFTAFTELGAGAGFARLGSLLAVKTLAVAGFVASLVSMTLIAGPAAAALSLLAGAATAFASSVSFGLVGGIAALGPAVLALGAAFSVLLISFSNWKDTATEAQKAAVLPLVESFSKLKEAVRGEFLKDLNGQVKLLVPLVGRLQGALVDVARVMRETANAALTMFSGDTAQSQNLQKLLDGLAGLTAKFGAAAVNASGAVVGMLAAALPIANKLASAIERLSIRFNLWVNSARGQNSLEQFFDRAWNSALKLFSIVGNVTKVIAHLFDLGQGTGDSFLDSINNGLERLDAWITGAGRSSVLKWFEDSQRFMQGLGRDFQALGRLFDQLDTGKSRDQIVGLTGVIEKFIDMLTAGVKIIQEKDFGKLGDSFLALGRAIRDNILPPLGKMFDLFTSGQSVSTVSLAMDVLRRSAELLGPVLDGIVQISELVVSAFSALPEPVQEVVIAFGLFKALNVPLLMAYAIRGVNNLIGAIKGLAASAKTNFILLAAAIATVAAFKIYDELTQGAKSAKEAQQKYNQQVQDFAKIMKDAGGPLGEFQNQLRDMLKSGQGDLGQLGKNLKDIGVNLDDLAVAAGKGGGNWDAFINQMQRSAEGTQKNAFLNEVFKLKIEELGQSVKDATVEYEDWIKTNAEQAAAITPAEKATQDYKKALADFADVTSDADTKLRGFQEALKILSGEQTMNLDRALSNAAEAGRDLVDSFNDVETGGKNIQDAFDQVTGKMNPLSASWHELDRDMQTVQGSFADVTLQAYEAAGGINNTIPATQAAQAAAVAYADDIKNKLTKELGLNEEQAQQVIEKYGLIPDNVTTVIEQAGAQKTIDDILKVSSALTDLEKQTVVVPVGMDATKFYAELAHAKAVLGATDFTASLNFSTERNALFGSMAGRIVDKPMVSQLGERGYKEAVIPLELPLNRVDPSVRGMAALIRGEKLHPSTYAGQPAPQRIYNNNVTVEARSADPDAVAAKVLNRLNSLGR